MFRECGGLEWSPNDKTLAILFPSKSQLMLWNSDTTQTFDIKMKHADFLLYSADSKYIVIGNEKGNVLFLDLMAKNEAMVIVGKHSKAITSGARWNDQIALSSQDKSISISNCNGDTLYMISSLKGTPSHLNVSLETL